jgi:hypothetical protein
VACCDDSLIASDRGAIPSGPQHSQNAFAACGSAPRHDKPSHRQRRHRVPIRRSVRRRSPRVAHVDPRFAIAAPAAGTSGVGFRDLSQQMACAIVKSALEPAVQRSSVRRSALARNDNRRRPPPIHWGRGLYRRLRRLAGIGTAAALTSADRAHGRAQRALLTVRCGPDLYT